MNVPKFSIRWHVVIVAESWHRSLHFRRKVSHFREISRNLSLCTLARRTQHQPKSIAGLTFLSHFPFECASALRMFLGRCLAKDSFCILPHSTRQHWTNGLARLSQLALSFPRSWESCSFHSCHLAVLTVSSQFVNTLHFVNFVSRKAVRNG
jgi:hypothetical protein